MNRVAVQYLPGERRRGVGWRLWAIGGACLVILACDGISLGPGKPALNGPLNESQILVDAANRKLVFVPAGRSQVELRGTATMVGDWTSRSTEIHGTIGLDADSAALNGFFDRIQTDVPNNASPDWQTLPTIAGAGSPVADISVPIASLHGDSEGMDRDMRSALKAGQFPSIEFVLQRLDHAGLEWDAGSHQAVLKLRVAGTLNMSGAGRPVTMDVLVTRDSSRHFLAHAETALLMTDFGVTPPGAFFGVIKAGDQVHAIFDLDLILATRSETRPTVLTRS